jgi:hypothetical protein
MANSDRVRIDGAHDAQLVPAIEGRRTSPARPNAGSATRYLRVAFWASIDVFRSSALDGFDAAAYFLYGRPGQLANLHCDTIVAMTSMPAAISIDPVTHVQELLGDDDFERLRLTEIDPTQIDQNKVLLATRVIHISSPDRPADLSADPTIERLSARGDP